jgi:PAS fold
MTESTGYTPPLPANVPWPEGEVTVENCAREPIHVPGLIQPHGALVAFDPASGWSLPSRSSRQWGGESRSRASGAVAVALPSTCRSRRQPRRRNGDGIH